MTYVQELLKLAQHPRTKLAQVWPLGDASGNPLSARGGDNATAVNGLTYGVPGGVSGEADTAIRFVPASASRIQFANSSTVDQTDSISIGALVKRSATGAGSYTILNKHGGAFILYFKNDYLTFGKTAGSTGTSTITDIVQSTVQVTDTNWHLVEGKKQGSTVQLFIDGEDVTGTVTNATLVTSTNAFFIGVQNYGGANYQNYFAGDIQHVFIADTRLTALHSYNLYRYSQGLSRITAPITVYVDLANGVDTRSPATAQSEATPWLTLDKAGRNVPDGSIVKVRAGTFTGPTITDAYHPGPRITMKPYEGETVTFQTSQPTFTGFSEGVNWRGFTQTAGLVLEAGVKRVAMENCSVTGQVTAINPGCRDITFHRITAASVTADVSNGIVFGTSGDTRKLGFHNIRITNCALVGYGNQDMILAVRFDRLLIQDSEFSGQVRHVSGPHTDVIALQDGGVGVTLRRVHIHDCEGQGVFISDGSPHKILLENVLVHDITGGFTGASFANARDVRIVNSLFDNTVDIGSSDANLTDAVIINSAFPDDLIRTSGGVIAYENYNYTPNVTGFTRGANDVTAGAMFVNQAAGNYRPVAGSTLLNAGVGSVQGFRAPADDLDGNSRAAVPEIGPYELV